jgi:hypothetical protein
MGFAIADKPVLSFDGDEHGGTIGGVDAAVAVVDAGDGAGSVADEALGHDEAGFFFVGGLLGVGGGRRARASGWFLFSYLGLILTIGARKTCSCATCCFAFVMVYAVVRIGRCGSV